MTIKLRFALLLGLFLACFLVALALLRRAERQETAAAQASVRQSRTHALERWLELSGQTLRQLANDYSLWDEMVKFVLTPTDEWAEINLVASLNTFNAEAYWVLNPQGTVVHHRRREPGASALAPPLAADAWLKLTARERFPWFFQDSPAGFLEIRGAPIQPSEDTDRNHSPYGWLIVARLWDAEHLADLGRLAGDEASLVAPTAAERTPASPNHLRIDRPLPNWGGHPVRILRLQGAVPSLEDQLQTDEREAQIFVTFGVLVLLVLAVTLQFWVIRPLNQLAGALASGQSAPLGSLKEEPSEFGRLAQLVITSFVQRSNLESEVEQRRRIEHTLRDKEASLRDAIEERVRLGRNLHDSVIQSIFASGLGLSAVRSLLRSDPPEAERRLEQVRLTLNDTIRDLRNFIIGLEPEALRRMSLTDAVGALVDLLRTAAPISVAIDINEAIAERLTASRRSDLLQITREALSNVLRHSGASTVQVALLADRDEAILLVGDDGRGFDPQAARNSGHGLSNIAERAAAAGAKLTFETALGKGTRVCVSFPLTPPLP